MVSCSIFFRILRFIWACLTPAASGSSLSLFGIWGLIGGFGDQGQTDEDLGAIPTVDDINPALP